MHMFRLYVTAGQNHPTQLAGVQMDAICMVDSSDTDQARLKASSRLAELGWASIAFRETILLPPGPDISGFSPLLVEAFGDARGLGVSLIVYPEQLGAA